MDDVVSRITRGDVNRMRPLDEAIGKNIKFTARHTASLFLPLLVFSVRTSSSEILLNYFVAPGW